MDAIRTGPGARGTRLLLAAAALLLLSGCAGGPASRWAPPADAAGFFVGLWHGALLLVTLVVSFFTDDVRIYEVHNTGIAYDIGFVLGALCVYGSGVRITTGRKPRRSEREWDEIGERIEKKIRRKISTWVDEEDWGSIGTKVEHKVKEGLRRWLDEEEQAEREGGA